MGLFERIFGFLFGDGRNVVVETAGAFRENAETGAIRLAQAQKSALTQYAAEFDRPQKGSFDRLMDGVNRLPRPALALGTLGLFVSAMIDPLWFGVRMQGLALVPEPLWWLLGAIVSFYFGARHQAKGQDFQRSITQTMARTGEVVENSRVLQALAAGADREEEAGSGSQPDARQDSGFDAPNPALTAWLAQQEESSRGE